MSKRKSHKILSDELFYRDLWGRLSNLKKGKSAKKHPPVKSKRISRRTYSDVKYIAKTNNRTNVNMSPNSNPLFSTFSGTNPPAVRKKRRLKGVKRMKTLSAKNINDIKININPKLASYCEPTVAFDYPNSNELSHM